MADNRKFNKKVLGKDVTYQQYSNYSAIEVPFTDAIPCDYDGVMGVPISFLDKYCPEQFKIIGITDRGNEWDLKTKEFSKEEVKNAADLNRRAALKVGEGYVSTYARLLIKKVGAP